MTALLTGIGWVVLGFCIAAIVRAEFRGEGVFRIDREEDQW